MQNDGSNNFDDIFKNKLQGLSADSNPSDWIMMERLLEMHGLTHGDEITDETRFDEVTIDKLNNIQTASLVPDWDRMSSMIDQMNEEPSMEPSEFDQAIDNKIKDNSIPLDMAVWDLMEPTLDMDRSTVIQHYDDITKEKLTSISEVESSWGTMNSKINRELFLPESIVKYKVIEVALILLFAFSAAQLPVNKILDNQSLSEKRADQDIPTSTIAEVDLPEHKTPTSNTQRSPLPHAATTTVDQEEGIDKQTSTSSNQSLDVIDDKITVRNLAEEQIWDLPPSIVDILDQYVSKPTFKFTNDTYAYLFQPKDIDGYASSLAFLDFYDQELVNSVFDTKKLNDSRIIQNINILDEIGSPILSQALLPGEFADIAALDKYRNNSGLILSIFTGSDYNEIVTPFNPNFAKEGSQQWNMGYAGGMALGMRFKNWELETGAIYASNQYAPTEAYSAASSLRDIELNIVKIPLNFRFNVNLWDKWKVYALSGATMNMVVQSAFTTENISAPASFTSGASLMATAKLAQKEFGQGILQGGSFKDNSFFTANLGLGLERTLNNKWSVFAQPTYQRQIFSSGIGPNQDRYNAVSLFLGTRVALSKKTQ